MVIMEEEKSKEYVMHNEKAQKNELNEKKLNINAIVGAGKSCTCYLYIQMPTMYLSSLQIQS